MAGLPQPPVFGPGLAWVKALTDITGSTLAIGTPRRVPNVQEFSCDIDMPAQPLYGENYFGIAQGRKPAKVSGKIKFSGFNAVPINSAMLGMSAGPASSGDQISWDEIHTIPSTPYQITVAPPNGGTFAEDLGVRYQATGAALTQVAVGSVVAQGEYSVTAAGLYTFEAGDSGLGVAIDYRYTVAVGVSQIIVAQEPLGNTPTFELTYRGVYRGLQVVGVFYNVISPKLTMASKLDNWNMPELDFECFEPTGIVGAPVCRFTFSQP